MDKFAGCGDLSKPVNFEKGANPTEAGCIKPGATEWTKAEKESNSVAPEVPANSGFKAGDGHGGRPKSRG